MDSDRADLDNATYVAFYVPADWRNRPRRIHNGV